MPDAPTGGPGLLVSAAHVVTPARILAPGWLLVSGDRIAAVGEGAPAVDPQVEVVDVGSATVVPGFVDVHCHGGGGASFTSGSWEEARAAAAAHLAAGTTTVVASLVTAGPAELAASVAALADLADEGVVAGVHLEGPWLSPRRAGAHEVAQLRDPDPSEIDALLEAGRGHVRMVTLAPELPGGLAAVRRLVAGGVTVAVGHTDATYDQTRAALDAGATVGTHLYNAMRGLHHREPGPIAALLGEPSTVVELVADGVHVHPAALDLAARSAAGRFALVSDAMAAAAAADGDYRLGPLEVQVRDGVARLADSGAIAGSTLTLGAAVRYAVRDVGLSLLDAVRAATATPASALGLADRARLGPVGLGPVGLGRVGAGPVGPGRLEAGAAADLAVLDADLRVTRVMRRGAWVTSPPRP